MSEDISRQLPHIVLHVGTPKTGTTFLQNSLAESRAVLREAGIAYHQIPPSLCACHWWFAIPYVDDLRAFESARIDMDNGVPLDKLVERGQASRRHFEAEVNGSRRVVVSAEQFFFLPRPVLQRIRDHFAHLGATWTIVVYVRDPVEAATSELNQKVKMGMASLAQGLAAPPIFPTRANIERFAEVFGRESVRVRRYRPGSPDETPDLVQDFCTAFVPEVDPRAIRRVSELNPSLCREALVIVDECNRSFLTDPPHAPRRERVLRALERMSGTRFALPAPTEAVLRQRAGPEIDYLRSAWGIEAPPARAPAGAGASPGDETLDRALRALAPVIEAMLQVTPDA